MKELVGYITNKLPDGVVVIKIPPYKEVRIVWGNSPDLGSKVWVRYNLVTQKPESVHLHKASPTEMRAIVAPKPKLDLGYLVEPEDWYAT